MIPVSLIAAASHFPERVVFNDYFGGDKGVPTGGMFQGTEARHHMSADASAVDLIVRATAKLEERLGAERVRGADIVLTNVSMPDLPFTGCGAEVAKRLELNPDWVYDLHSQGCVSFISMMSLAQSLMTTYGAKRALICNVQTAAGRIFCHDDVRQRPQAAVPGDGCGVALLEAGDAQPVQTIKVKCFAQNASDMQIASEDGRRWWEPGDNQFHIDFSRRKVAAIFARGNRLVPQIVLDACEDAGIAPQEIGTLITNQPNRLFLRNWRDALQVPEERHIDTFREHGNLFGAAMPVCLERGVNDGTIESDSYVVFGGFSHAGDYAAAAVVRWKGAA